MKRLDPALLKTNVDAAAAYDLDRRKVFGSAYSVVQGDAVVYESCYGTTAADSADPVTPRTLFRLASMTKPVTAMAALILVDRGLLRLSDLVSDYLPAFDGVRVTAVGEDGSLVDLGAAQSPITIRDLLTHTSGIGTEWAKPRLMTEEERISVNKTVDFYARVGLDFDPGTRQQYSGTAAFDVMVRIIEQVTGEDFLAFLKREIFDPCGMPDTTFIPNEEQWGRLIRLHNRVEGENSDEPNRAGYVYSNWPCTRYVGGAGLVSTLRDFTNFATMLLHRGATPTGRIVRPETFDLLPVPYVPREIMPHNENWGLGVRVIVGEDYDLLPVGAYGWSGAHGTHFWIDPVNEVAAVMMKNSRVDGGSYNESACNFERAVKAAILADA